VFLCCVLLQIFCLSLCIFALALVGVFYPYNRGALFTALIVLYALTACIAGYISTSYYMQVRVPDRCVHSLPPMTHSFSSTLYESLRPATCDGVCQ
jgi:hypothetical protein